jgi:hypothetical protein
MIRHIALIAVAIVMFVATLAVPRQAEATDNLEYIIPAAVGGAVAVVAIIAILMADRSEPEYELAPWPPPAATRRGAVQLAPACAPNAQSLPLICW